METRQQSFHKQETWPVNLVSKTKFRRTRASSADGKKGDENEGQSNPKDAAHMTCCHFHWNYLLSRPKKLEFHDSEDYHQLTNHYGIHIKEETLLGPEV